MKAEYEVYRGRGWQGWNISATMTSRQDSDGLPDDVVKDVVIHSPSGELVIPYGTARILMSHINAAFTRIDNTYRNQHEHREEKMREWSSNDP